MPSSESDLEFTAQEIFRLCRPGLTTDQKLELLSQLRSYVLMLLPEEHQLLAAHSHLEVESHADFTRVNFCHHREDRSLFTQAEISVQTHLSIPLPDIEATRNLDHGHPELIKTLTAVALNWPSQWEEARQAWQSIYSNLASETSAVEAEVMSEMRCKDVVASQSLLETGREPATPVEGRVVVTPYESKQPAENLPQVQSAGVAESSEVVAVKSSAPESAVAHYEIGDVSTPGQDVPSVPHTHFPIPKGYRALSLRQVGALTGHSQDWASDHRADEGATIRNGRKVYWSEAFLRAHTKPGAPGI